MEPPMEQSGGEQEPGAVRLLDLPWEDVLLPHVLSRVPLRQLLRLQRVKLDLTACRQLKDEAIVYLAQRRGAGLRSLSLAVNANVGDVAVQELARNCPELQHLDLTGCLRVGSDGVRTLAEYCPALRSLRVRHCHHVAEPSLSRLRKRGVDIDVEPPLHQALVLLQDMAGFAPFVNLQV
ncbi:hypothetical protein E2I00_018202 [Balaenoptera physalus]|uniref:F-box domain-containing protein n=1 Tax=Balaenoptera physalus TaxID=9770 RepID=A0A643BYJ0_BALPH|nr:hypothetical protein E2I00_018202 [Balaenoptera physalus]